MTDGKQVQDFYSVLRYPGPDALITYLWANRIRPYVPEDGFTFLDAGCGSGRHSAGMLDVYKNAQGYCLDFSKPSLEEAQSLCKAKGFDDRAKFIHASYLEPIDLPELVDVAMAIGTIHHTTNPAGALINIAATVKPGGYVACMVYGTRGHRRRYEVKEALKLVGTDENAADLYNDYIKTYEGFMDLPLRVLIRNAKNRIGQLVRRVLGRKTYGYYLGATNDIMRTDAMLNPIDEAYAAAEVREMIEGAGLEVVEMLGLGRFDATLLPPKWRDGWEKLSFWDKVRVMELIDPMPKSWSFICRKPAH